MPWCGQFQWVGVLRRLCWSTLNYGWVHSCGKIVPQRTNFYPCRFDQRIMHGRCCDTKTALGKTTCKDLKHPETGKVFVRKWQSWKAQLRLTRHANDNCTNWCTDSACKWETARLYRVVFLFSSCGQNWHRQKERTERSPVPQCNWKWSWQGVCFSVISFGKVFILGVSAVTLTLLGRFTGVAVIPSVSKKKRDPSQKTNLCESWSRILAVYWAKKYWGVSGAILFSVLKSWKENCLRLTLWLEETCRYWKRLNTWFTWRENKKSRQQGRSFRRSCWKEGTLVLTVFVSMYEQIMKSKLTDKTPANAPDKAP